MFSRSRALPAGFIAPCLPSPAPQPPFGELWLHAVRDFVYAILFATLPFVAWCGTWSLVLVGLIVFEIVVTLADFTGPERGVRLSRGQYGGEPDGRHGLAIAAELSAQGRFQVPVQEVFPAARAAEAHASAARGPRQGKIALDLARW